MKKITNIFSITVSLLLMLTSCGEEFKWKENKVETVSIYSVSEIKSDANLFVNNQGGMQNIYPDQLLHVETQGVTVTSFDIMNYTDESSEEEYIINYSTDKTVSYIVDTTVPAHEQITKEFTGAYYEYNALKADGVGTYKLYELVKNEAGEIVDTVLINTYSMMIQETEGVY